MPLYALGPLHPTLAPGSWVAPTATLVGDVHLGEKATVWFGAVLRGDNDTITVGHGSNVQDNAVLHADQGVPLTIGQNVTVGHQAMLHGCTVGAGALVTEGRVFEDGWLILGAPAKAVRPLTADEIAGLARPAATYQAHAARYTQDLKAWTV